MGKKKILAPVQEEEVVRFCQDLIRIKSVNPPGDEIAIAQYVASVLEAAGLEVELITHSTSRASVLARLKSDRQKPGLLLCAHLDTVPTGSEKWLHEPFDGELADGKIWGRGAADMKGGLAVLMITAKLLAEARIPIRGDLVIAATAGEETDSIGAASIAVRPDLGTIGAVVIPEPSDNDLYVAEKGALWLELTTHGRTAHGSMPHLGQNAIMMMTTLIHELQGLPLPCEKHPMLGGLTQSVNTISGGT